jgi:hypothetical protein
MGNALQNVYMAALFVSFDFKNVVYGRKFVQDANGNPNRPWPLKFLTNFLAKFCSFLYTQRNHYFQNKIKCKLREVTI